MQTRTQAIRIGLAILLSIGIVGVAQSQAIRGPIFEVVPANVAIYENVPSLIPAVAADVVTGDIWLEEITLANKSGSTVTVTMVDKQGTPREILPAVTIAANTVYVIGFKARYSPGGVNWVATSGTAVVGTVRGKRLGQ